MPQLLNYLGPETDDLNHRFIRAFADLGFSVELHPEFVLTASLPAGALYLNITRPPSRIRRLEPASALLVAFGYGVSRSGKSGKKQRARLGVNSPCSYVAGSRTSAGRSPAAGVMQMLVMAIPAKETGGYLHADGDEVSVSGDAAVELAMQELARFEKFNFDAYAHRFESWPPLDKNQPFTWPPEILPPVAPVQVPAKTRKKFSAFFWISIFMVSPAWNFPQRLFPRSDDFLLLTTVHDYLPVQECVSRIRPAVDIHFSKTTYREAATDRPTESKIFSWLSVGERRRLSWFVNIHHIKYRWKFLDGRRYSGRFVLGRESVDLCKQPGAAVCIFFQ